MKGTVQKIETLGDGGIKLAVYMSGNITLEQAAQLSFKEVDVELSGALLTMGRNESMQALVEQGERLVSAHSELVSMIKDELGGGEVEHESVTMDMNKPNGACNTSACAFHERGNCYNQGIGNQCTQRTLPESTVINIGTCYNMGCDFHDGENGCTDNPPYSCEMHQPNASEE